MKYMLSKNKHAKEMLDVMLKELDANYWVNVQYENWIEPFVGGANFIDKVPKVFSNIIGADINRHLIAMFNMLHKGWTPPENVTEEEYQALKRDSLLLLPENHEAMIGFVGIGCSYSGKWFGGYARGNDKNGKPRNYAKESHDNLMKQRENLHVKFIHSDYKALTLPINGRSIIYCDPPYQGTTKYKNGIDYNDFWKWCDMQTERGNKVFVSEYNAPEGWRCIWEKKVNNSLTKETGSKQGIEKLFTK